MGKKKGTKGSAASASAPKCTCDHPFKCDCGNRPERPSRGHKWDGESQTWGGKGHKQKGGSGQTSSVSKEATTTALGKTKIEQWQRLPCKLLEEHCRKEGRPRPKFKSLDGKGNKFLYRVIVQDAKKAKQGTDHDIILVPKNPVANEEQAKEEAALLALLHLTPSLPHERKLPEPYKSTWLHAVQSAKQASKQKAAASKENSKQHKSSEATSHLSKTNDSGARASTNLTTAHSYISAADRRKQQQEKQKARVERIRKHEAIRIANQDHPVFLSAVCRKQIESLLRDGMADLNTLEEEEGPEDDDDDEEDLLKAYVLDRLHHEGFTRSQARTSYAQLGVVENVHEDGWDKIYDECLQWLCIHLDEDQLPEGFDPRGRTLDVVVAPTTMSRSSSNITDSSTGGKNDAAILELSTKYGITAKDAFLISRKVSPAQSISSVMWNTLCEVAETKFLKDGTPNDECLEKQKEEFETLEAIFAPDEYKVIANSNNTTTVCIDMQENMKLEIVMENGVYPEVHPKSIFVTGGWTGKLKGLGAALHVELLKFVGDLLPGDGMVYSIYGETQNLLHAATDGELPSATLLAQSSMSITDKATKKTAAQPTKDSKERNKPASSARRPNLRRPRQRGFFWSVKPKDSPPAEAFPSIGPSMERARKGLPAAKARGEFLSIMKKADKEGRVVLVTGETGCGKTTQIPQYILEDAPLGSKIVVAQPRRLAATGVAQRVANERGESEAGKGSVGYVVRGDVAMSDNTRLTFCTTGVLLRQLQSERALDAITHVIVDEVHERHLDTDVLLGVLKECLTTTPHLRVVLMSATLDADRFAAYWGKNTPRMHIPGRTFPVEDYTLEDVLSITGYIPPKKGKKKKGYNGYRPQRKPTAWDDSEKSDGDDDDGEEDDRSRTTSTTGSQGTNPQSQNNVPPVEELIKRVDETNVDYDMLGHLVRHLISTKARGDDGSILVFLSGAPEINRAQETIRKMARGLSMTLLPLHGGLQPKDQNLVFRPAQKDSTKVILSTNVAETSITIPDCTIVIDSCREKQSSYDPANRMPLLLERFASLDSLKQRRGRAGRVQKGTCYKLISRSTLSKLPEHGEPEIKRCALDQTLLSLLFLGVECGTGNFLNKLLDPPSQQSINAAILSLTKLGAAEAIENGNISLTPLGVHLAGIPAPPPVGKVLIVSSILGCRTAGLAMAAGMSVGRSPFLRINTYYPRGGSRNNEVDEKDAIEQMKNQNILDERECLFKKVGNSDHALLAACFLEWNNKSGGGEKKRFCEKLGLNFNLMREMKQSTRQLDSSLSSVGFFDSAESDRNDRFWRIIRASTVAALSPAQIVRVQRPSTKYTETVEGAVEKEGAAKELKFYIRGAESEPKNEQEGPASSYRGYHGVAEERCFMHPSSANFSVGNYSCPWLVYFQLVRTSKSFLRDATESSAYALLLFGGKIEVQAAQGIIVIDDYIRLAANARIGALIGGLRRKVDDLLSKKVVTPSLDIAATVEMKLIVNLLKTDGLGN